MAVTRETLKLLGGIRIRVADGVDAATDDLVRSWARAWKIVEEDWKAAIEELPVADPPADPARRTDSAGARSDVRGPAGAVRSGRNHDHSGRQRRHGRGVRARRCHRLPAAHDRPRRHAARVAGQG
jgi:hypothetical protein